MKGYSVVVRWNKIWQVINFIKYQTLLDYTQFSKFSWEFAYTLNIFRKLSAPRTIYFTTTPFNFQKNYEIEWSYMRNILDQERRFFHLFAEEHLLN